MKRKKIYDVWDLTHILGVCRAQVYNYIHNGQLIPAARVSGKCLFNKESVDSFLKNRRGMGRPKKKQEEVSLA